ncbi:DUF2860 family protein [Shewanella halifaxensis]|uniref:DUF2860 family protein n=1 Tax=Shewanella halifaxensis TaxID=271098 RepID=UPI000D59D636|nr:DUF2860 family protein [Shewanella halifaxensis]
MKKVSLLSIAILSSLATGAQAAESSRLSGEVIFATGYISTNSNLSTEGDAVLTDLSIQGAHHDDFIVMPLGSVAYELGEARNHRLYLGTSRDDLAVGDLAFEIGYQFDMQNGTQLDLAYLPTVLSGEVWQDPYLQGKRSKTDIDGHAFRAQVNNIMGSGFSLDMAYATTEVEQERIQDEDLLRDSEMYYIKAGYLTHFTPSMGLSTSISYLHNDADGKAQTYDQYELEVSYFFNHAAHTVALTGSHAYRDYDGFNSVFSKTRADNKHRLFVAYEYANIAGLNNWNLVSFTGVTFNDSNINFYKSEDYLTSIGLSYRF